MGLFSEDVERAHQQSVQRQDQQRERRRIKLSADRDSARRRVVNSIPGLVSKAKITAQREYAGGGCPEACVRIPRSMMSDLRKLITEPGYATTGTVFRQLEEGTFQEIIQKELGDDWSYYVQRRGGEFRNPPSITVRKIR